MLTLLGGSALFSILPFLRSLPQGRIHLRLMSRVWGRHWPFSRWLLVMTGLTFAHEQAIYIGIGMLLGDKPAGRFLSDSEIPVGT